MAFLEKCNEYFGSTDFYDILKLDRDADANAVKKAYHRASLLIHPDRVPEQQKLEATEKFKTISKIYSVLSEQEKRKTYDESGSFDEESCDNLSEWLNAWRSMFKTVTVDCIDKYKAEYINSDSELRDIKKAYIATKGNMTKMHNMIPFLDVANEDRIIAIVRNLIDDDDEVEEYDGFFNEPKAKKLRRKRKEDSYNITDEEAEKLLQDILGRREKQGQAFAQRMADLEEKYCKKKTAIKGKKPQQDTATEKRVTRGRVAKKGRK